MDLNINIHISSDGSVKINSPVDKVKKELKKSPVKKALKRKVDTKKSDALELRLMAQDDQKHDDADQVQLELDVIDHVEDMLKKDPSKAKAFLNDNKHRFSKALREVLMELIKAEEDNL